VSAGSDDTAIPFQPRLRRAPSCGSSILKVGGTPSREASGRLGGYVEYEVDGRAGLGEADIMI
jgi:hypothetical protein